ncbi:MAG TPA: phosphate ABC transporter ATP-binding protein, partial [Gammaproteobacteria bacterium]|nr:phosphate ABC transporter ATP-binding protein [Gammaproteobacteria bacterium]
MNTTTIEVQTTLDSTPSPATRETSLSSAQIINYDHQQTVGRITVDNPKMVCRDVNVYYAEKRALKQVSLDIGANEVISFIGPSGCGKSTFLRC